MKKNRFSFFFLLLYGFLFSQENKSDVFKGKIVSQSGSLDEIHIINISKDIGVLSDNGGYFNIKASVNDTLMFSAVHLKGHQRRVVSEDFEKELVLVPMEVIEYQLTGVTITKYSNINAESLGIIPKGQKEYSPAERKLNAAGGIGIVGLINAINGQKKMLKKELEVEKKELLQIKTADFFTKEYIINTLKIPEEYVEGFIFYIVEDARFTNEMKKDNKTMATFILGQLVDEYLKLKELDKKENKDEQ